MSLILDALRPVDCQRAAAAGRLITGAAVPGGTAIVEVYGLRLRAPYTSCDWDELPTLIAALGWPSLRVQRRGRFWRIRRGGR